jgi:hypothetical protein
MLHSDIHQLHAGTPSGPPNTVALDETGSLQRSLLVSLSSLFLMAACVITSPPVVSSDSERPPAATSDADELAAFARLYGDLRFFHPSDAAAEGRLGHAGDHRRPRGRR